MTTIITPVVLVNLRIVLVDAYGDDCIIRDNDPIENCCNLEFTHSKFSSVVNKRKVYDV